MVQRFQEQGQTQFGNLDTGGQMAAGAVSDLGSRLKESEFRRREKKLRKAEERATVQAQKDFEEKARTEDLSGAEISEELTLEQRGLRGFFNQRANAAYNKSLNDAYRAKVVADTTRGIQQLAIDNPDDLQSFREKSEGLLNGVLEGIDEDFRPEAAQKLALIRDRLDVRVATNFRERQRAEAKVDSDLAVDEFKRNAATAYREGDNEAGDAFLNEARIAIDNQVGGGFITAEQGAAKMRGLQLESAEQMLKHEVQSIFSEADSLEAGAVEAKAFIDDQRQNVIQGASPDEHDAIMDMLDSDYRQNIAGIKKADAALKKAQDMSDSIARGKAYYDQINPPNPADSQYQKDIDNYYQQRSQGIEDLPPKAQVAFNVDFVNNTKVMPDSLKNQMANALQVGNPEQMEVMAETAAQLSNIDPRYLQEMSADDRAQFKRFNDQREAGALPEDIMEREKERARSSGSQLTVWDQKFTEFTKRDGVRKVVDDTINKEFRELFSFDPTVSDEMIADVTTFAKAALPAYQGDINSAVIDGLNQARRVWGVTDIGAGGRRFMKHSPEARYAIPGMDVEPVIKQQFSDFAELHGLDADKLLVTTNREVATSDEPKYPVLFVDPERGVRPLLDDNNQPINFKPDLTPEFSNRIREDLRGRIEALNEPIRIRTSREFFGDGQEGAHNFENATPQQLQEFENLVKQRQNEAKQSVITQSARQSTGARFMNMSADEFNDFRDRVRQQAINQVRREMGISFSELSDKLQSPDFQMRLTQAMEQIAEDESSLITAEKGQQLEKALGV